MLAPRNVRGNTGFHDNLAVVIALNVPTVADPRHCAVRARDPIVNIIGSALIKTLEGASHVREILGMDCLEPEIGIGVKLGAGSSPDLLESWIDIVDCLPIR